MRPEDWQANSAQSDGQQSRPQNQNAAPGATTGAFPPPPTQHQPVAPVAGPLPAVPPAPPLAYQPPQATPQFAPSEAAAAPLAYQAPPPSQPAAAEAFSQMPPSASPTSPGGPSAPYHQAPPTPPAPPLPPAGARGAATPPPAGRPPKKSGLGWPMAFLILGLATIGGCCYSFANFTSSVFSPIEFGSAQPSVGVLVMENEISGSVWATDAIHKFKKDANIKSVVIRINSPGGAVAPCQEIYNALKALQKPIVVSMGSVAASGGLYVAAAGDHIMANPGTITGSIGVIMQSVEVSGTMDKLGLKSQTIKSGEFKDMGSPFRALKNNERELLQKMVNDVYEQFLADLTEGRKNMKPEDLRNLADGRIFTGAEAKEAGLVDELGGFEEALLRAAKLGGLPPNKRPELVVEDGRKPWWETVIHSKSQSPGLSLPPALTPGFSLKYIYQPDLGSASSGGN